MRIKPSNYYWYGAACPVNWKDAIRNKLMHENEIKPIIKSIIGNFTSYKRGLKFYFVDEKGDIEAVHWHSFLKEKKFRQIKLCCIVKSNSNKKSK